MHHENYKGHAIAVGVRKLGKGYVWYYQIDGGPLHNQLGDRPMPKEIAEDEGIDEAKRAVDRK